MNISYNWLSQYIDLEGLTIENISEILTTLGLEVSSVEKKETIKGGLKGIVVGEVKECSQHPNADKLSVTKVDLGKGDLLSIVCGAPNVATGQKVLVATIGTTLYDKEGKEFAIKKSNLRGVNSEGMICAEDELGLGEDHKGILVLPADVKIGTLAKDYFHVEEDFIFEVELTPNRSDATSHIGVARDLAAYLKINKGHTGKVTIPDVSDFKSGTIVKQIEVMVENIERCPRYAGVTLTNVKIKESPGWLKNRLLSIGLRPINNVVDITNFVLHELGQPLHAFDADKIAGNTLRIKTLPKDTPFVSLDEVERKLRETDLMICDDLSNPLCLGGVFGGFDSGVSDSTVNIFLESAYFNPKSIRVSSMKHNLRTDAALIFEKGADPEITLLALKRAALLIKKLADANISGNIIDIYPEKINLARVKVYYKKVNDLIGIDIDNESIDNILDALNFKTLEKSNEYIIVEIPGNKYDVNREADVIEEILRIYGLNKVPIPSKISISVNHTEEKEKFRIRNFISDYLTNQGFNEAMSLSIVESEKIKKISEEEFTNAVYINNTSNVNLNAMRTNLLLSALENVKFNSNRQQRDISMYEFGKAYQFKNNDISEKEYLSFYMCGRRFPESWIADNNRKTDFFSVKGHLENILAKLNVTKYQQVNLDSDRRFEYGLKLTIAGSIIAEYGKIKPSLAQSFDIRQDIFYCEIDFDNLLKFNERKLAVGEVSKYPTSRRDLALIIDKTVKFEDIEKTANKVLKKLLKSINLFDVYDKEEHVGKGKISYAISLLFEDKTRTLQDKEIDKELGKLVYILEKELGVQVRK